MDYYNDRRIHQGYKLYRTPAQAHFLKNLTEIKEYDENKLETKILRKNGSLGS